jgi:hypothetical protein
MVGIKVAPKSNRSERFELRPPIFNPLKFERVRSRIHTTPAPINGIFLNLLRFANTVMETSTIKIPKR